MAVKALLTNEVGIDIAKAIRENTASVQKLNDLEKEVDTLNQGGLNLKEDFIGEQVNNWLDKHPEATTTVQDKSLTYKKLVVGTLGYVTPEMYGAIGDGVADDTNAFQKALDSDVKLLLLPNKYKFGSVSINKPKYILGGNIVSEEETTFTIENQNDITFDSVNMVLGGESRGGDNGAIHIESCENISILNCTIITNNYVGVKAINSDKCFVDKCVFESFGTSVYFKDTNGIITNNESYQTTTLPSERADHNIDVELTESNAIYKVNICGNIIKSLANAIQVTSFSNVSADAKGVVISDNNIETINTTRGVVCKFDGVKNGSFVNNHVVDCGIVISAIGTSGKTGNLTISNNIVDNFEQVFIHGFNAHNAYNYEYGILNINNNKIIGNGEFCYPTAFDERTEKLSLVIDNNYIKSKTFYFSPNTTAPNTEMTIRNNTIECLGTISLMPDAKLIFENNFIDGGLLSSLSTLRVGGLFAKVVNNVSIMYNPKCAGTCKNMVVANNLYNDGTVYKVAEVSTVGSGTITNKFTNNPQSS